MPITKKKKVALVDDLSGSLSGILSLVFVKFNRLTVKDSNELRRSLQKDQVSYRVAKKTLLARALESKKYEGTLPSLEGEIAVAFGNDLLAPARQMYEFQKTHKDMVEIVGGVFEGVYKTKEEMLAIATIPPLATLRGMFVNIINSPIARFAVVLNAISEKKQ